MSAVTLKAHYDGERLILDEPCELPINSPLILTVQPLTGADSERVAWAEANVQMLARAYGDDEPEYTDADLKS